MGCLSGSTYTFVDILSSPGLMKGPLCDYRTIARRIRFGKRSGFGRSLGILGFFLFLSFF